MSAVGKFTDEYYEMLSYDDLLHRMMYFRAELAKKPPLERRKKLIIRIRQIAPIMARKEQDWHNVPIEDDGEMDL